MSLGTPLVIIPTYNEVENIDIAIARLRAAVPQADVLVVDDNSPDGTGRLADSLADKDSHIHVMHRKIKNGMGAAYLKGFEWGLDRGYPVLVEMDADGSHAPEQLPDLLAALETADMVKGSRYVPGGKVVNWPKTREILSRGGSLWTRLMMSIPLRDITGGFNAFRATTMAAILPEISSAGFNIQVDLTYHALQEGFKVVEVPITFTERERGKSKMSSKIVVEALFKTTIWGISVRMDRVRTWLRGLR
jgi:dolichol-phosphate mannosyltransferase